MMRCLRCITQVCSGHSDWILAERALSRFPLGLCVQVAPGLGTSKSLPNRPCIPFEGLSQWDYQYSGFASIWWTLWVAPSLDRVWKKNHGVLLYFCAMRLLNKSIRSKWIVDNPRFPEIGAEVNKYTIYSKCDISASRFLCSVLEVICFTIKIGLTKFQLKGVHSRLSYRNKCLEGASSTKRNYHHVKFLVLDYIALIMEYARCMEMDALTLVQSLFHWQATILMLITMGMKLCGKVRNKFALSQLWKGCTENEFTCSSGLCVDMEKRWLGLLNEQLKIY